MKIIILTLPKQRIRNTARYIHKEFGQASRAKFIAEVNRIVYLLRENPKLGPIEPYLEGASVPYRSIVIKKLNKLIYWVHDDVIEIVDFWNNRQNPETQAGRLR